MNSRMQKHGVVKVIRTDKASASFQFKALTLSGAFRRSKAGIYGRISIGGQIPLFGRVKKRLNRPFYRLLKKPCCKLFYSIFFADVNRRYISKEVKNGQIHRFIGQLRDLIDYSKKCCLIIINI